MDRYSVNVYDCAGLYREMACPSFGAALLMYAFERARWRGKGKAVLLVNEDCVDLGREDGLTEDERDAVETADMEFAEVRHAG